MVIQSGDPNDGKSRLQQANLGLKTQVWDSESNMKPILLGTTALILILGIVTPVKAQLGMTGNNGTLIARDDSRNDYYRDRQNDRYYSDRDDDNTQNDYYSDSSDRSNQENHYNDIDQVFRAVIGRNADRSGLRFYSRRMDSGWSIDQVREHLAYSPAAQRAINEIYREILGRNAEPEGLDLYSRRLARDWSLRQVRHEIADSKEAKNRRHH